MNIRERLEAGREIDPVTGCWNWTKGKSDNGRGSLSIQGKTCTVYKVAYEVYCQVSIPDGDYVCHSCDNPTCFNPDHLFVGSSTDNNHDMIAKGRAKYQQCVVTPEIHAKIERYRDAGWNLPNACRLGGATVDSYANYCKRHGIKRRGNLPHLTPVQQADVVRLIEEGKLSRQEIADRYHITLALVNKYWINR